MTYTQLVTPNPDIPCEPGWCLQYVRQAFYAYAVEPTATAAWNNAQYKHDASEPIPGGVYVPIWFSLETEPAGHVALMAPDGSVYSTSDPVATTPTHHVNLADLIQAYARYNPLNYLGWTEDISNVRVIECEDDMPSSDEVVQDVLNFEIDQVGAPGKITLGSFLAEYRTNNNKVVENTAAWVLPDVLALREIVSALAVKQGVTIDYDEIARRVNDEAAKRLKS